MTELNDGLTLDPVEREAMDLAWAAIGLDRARLAREQDPEAFVSALEENLQIWVAIKAAVKSSGQQLPAGLHENLIRLSDFVVSTILSNGATMPDHSVDTIVNINLQVSEGLLESLQ